MSNRVRYTVDNVKSNRFYQMPKFLFEGEFKEGLSNDAKVLYSLLRDRHELSLQNQWINENNEVYLIYTRDNMADMLGCSQPTLRKSIKQLMEFGLMEEERMGFNRANRIYLTTVTLDNTGVKDSFSPECKILSVRSENNLQSRVKDSFSQECKILSPNDTDFSDTDFSDTDIQSIKQSIVPIDRIDQKYKTSYHNSEDKTHTASLDSTTKYKSIIADNIEYDYLKDKYKLIVDDILNIMVDVVTSTRDYIRVNGEDKSTSIVKSVYLKLNQFHIEYVIDSLDNTTSKASNIRAYLITTLYNSFSTINSYYSNQVQHDMCNK